MQWMFVPFAAFFVLVVVAIIFGFKAAAERRRKLARWAAGHGMSYIRDNDDSLDYRWPDFDSLNQGHDRYGYNVMEGTWAGMPIAAFDYHYETGSGDDETSWHFSAVILTAPLRLKPLAIRKEGFFDKIGDFFGAGDIDFESAEFSRRFYVKSPDRKWAYDVIHTRMMEYLMANGRYTIEFDHRSIIVEDGDTWDPAQFAAAAEFIRGMIDRFPDYLRRQQGLAQPPPPPR